MWIVEVIPIKRGLKKDTLSYFSSEEVREGALVQVPLRSKTIDAIVIYCRDARDEKQAIKSGTIKLRKITKVKKESAAPSYVFKTAHIAATYYRRPRGEMLDYIVPDFSYFLDTEEKSTEEDVQPERLLLQAPLEERISYYRTFTREAFAKKESITLIVPTISGCNYFKEAVGRGISDFVVTLHSDLTKKKKNEEIAKLRSEDHPLITICTPSYASLLRTDTGTIIVENENSHAYTTPTTPSYDFRVLIEILARTAGKKLILSDSLLRIETLGRREKKEFGTIAPITFRSLTPLDIKLIPHGIPDEVPRRLRNEQLPALAEGLQPVFEKHDHIFCFAMRTGLSTFTRCRDCGSVLSCKHCDATLVLYNGGENNRVFICTKCKRHTPSEQKCGRCGSWNLAALGTGSAFVEEELKRLYPDTPIFRLDREVIKTKTEAKKVIKQYFTAPKAILVGTEMALYYLTDTVDTSIIVSFDTLFNIPSYKTHERITQLILSIGEKTKKKLYIQTKHTQEPIIETIEANNYATWYRKELEERKEFMYPPFATVVKISWRGKESEKTAAYDYLGELFHTFKPDIFEAITTIRGKKVATVNVIIRLPKADWSYTELLDGKELSPLLRKALAQIPPETIVSINPENLL